MANGEILEINMNRLSQLDDIIRMRISSNADDSYVAELHRKGINKILEKVGEESTEFILAAKDCASNSEDKQNAHFKQALIAETADLWFHSLIALAECNLTSEEVLQELTRRFGTSGIAEKTSRKIYND